MKQHPFPTITGWIQKPKITENASLLWKAWYKPTFSEEWSHIIRVDCIPKAQQRHRHTKSGHTWDPSSSDKRALMDLMHNQLPKEPYTGPLCVNISLYMPYPKKWLRTGKYTGLIKGNAPIIHSKKPDLDNLIKLLFDCCNKRLWNDDSQVWSIKSIKAYSLNPGIAIRVEEIDEG